VRCRNVARALCTDEASFDGPFGLLSLSLPPPGTREVRYRGYRYLEGGKLALICSATGTSAGPPTTGNPPCPPPSTRPESSANIAESASNHTNDDRVSASFEVPSHRVSRITHQSHLSPLNFALPCHRLMCRDTRDGESGGVLLPTVSEATFPEPRVGYRESTPLVHEATAPAWH